MGILQFIVMQYTLHIKNSDSGCMPIPCEGVGQLQGVWSAALLGERQERESGGWACVHRCWLRVAPRLCRGQPWRDH